MSNQQQATTKTMSMGDILIPKASDRSDRALNTTLETSEDREDVILAYNHNGISWDDVLKSIQDANEEYLTKSEKNTPKNVYNGHKNKALIMTLHSLTDMIPDQDGLSVMRGGLKLIFKVGKILPGAYERASFRLICRLVDTKADREPRSDSPRL